MTAPQKHRACNRPGRPFCDKACNRIGGLATNPPCGKPIEDYSTLHKGPRQEFVTEGPRQRFVTEGGAGDRDKFLFRDTAIWDSSSAPTEVLTYEVPISDAHPLGLLEILTVAHMSYGHSS